MVLDERPGKEIAFGAVGVFWGSEIRWQPVPLEAFAAFLEPGFGKIACNFSVRPYGDRRSMLTFDCRVALTDPVSQRGFDRYWRLVRPFVGHIMRAALAAIATDATRVTSPTST